MRNILYLLFILTCVQGYSQEEEFDTIPELQFHLTVEHPNTTVKFYKNDELKLDTLVFDSLTIEDDLYYGHDYKITYSKKKYAQKTIVIYTKDYSGVEEELTVVEFTMYMDLLKEYKSKKPVLIPVAIMMIDESGLLNFDFKYIQERKKAINESKKKKYRKEEGESD